MNWIRKIIKDYFWLKGKDDSLTWQARRRILIGAFTLGVIFAVISAILVNYFLPQIGGIFVDNKVFASALVLGPFGIIFGLGNWIIKNDDIKKQFKDTFIGQNELLFSNAVRALFEKPTKNENAINIHGFKEIVRLAHNNLIEKDRIDAVTAANHNLRGANLNNAVLKGFDLRSVCLLESFLQKADLRNANLTGADLRRADLRGANLRGADLREANLTGTDLREADLIGARLPKDESSTSIQTILQIAVCDEHTKFSPDYESEEHGLKKNDIFVADLSHKKEEE